MGLVLIAVLPSILLHMCTAHAKDAEMTVLPSRNIFFIGEDIHVVCNIEEEGSKWIYTLQRNGHSVLSGPSQTFDLRNLTETCSGQYQCVAQEQVLTKRIKESNVVPITVRADKPKAVLTVNGETVLRGLQAGPEMTCAVNDSHREWKYEWTIQGNEVNVIKDTQTIRVRDVGKYTCRGINEKSVYSEDSDAVYVSRELPDKATVKVQEIPDLLFYPGETIFMTCDVGGENDWTFEWKTTSRSFPPANRQFNISSASEAHSGDYWCKGRKGLYSSTKWSPALSITVANYKPGPPRLSASKAYITSAGNAYLKCYLDGFEGWRMFFFGYHEDFTESFKILDLGSDTTHVGTGGVYFCRAGRGDPLYFTEKSNAVTIEFSARYRIWASLLPDWLPLFSGESVTVTCRVYRDFSEQWFYKWLRPNADYKQTNETLYISNVTAAHSGRYRCQAINQQDPYFTTEWSYPITVHVSSKSPEASLNADAMVLPAGGIVTLICSVSPASSGWLYYWYKDSQSTVWKTTEAAVLSITDRGRYWCQGGRGSPIFYTQLSEAISIQETDNINPVAPDDLPNEESEE